MALTNSGSAAGRKSFICLRFRLRDGTRPAVMIVTALHNDKNVIFFAGSDATH